MSLSSLSIRRPVFITCLLMLIVVLGIFAFLKLPVDLFPDVTFPIVTISTEYPGAGPKEIETLVSRPLEEEMGTISGIKTIRSSNREGLSMVVAEFTLSTDVKYAEQQVRDKISSARRKLPEDIKDPVIRRIDPSDQPIMMISLKANVPMSEKYDLAQEGIRPLIETIPSVGLVQVLGGRKREIHVELDRRKLADANLSVSGIDRRLRMTGQNIPAGSVTRESSGQDMVFRTVGEFSSVKEIAETTVNFFGNDRPIRLGDVGAVKDTLADAASYTFLNGDPNLLLYVFKQSGSNTIQVAENIKTRVQQINEDIKTRYPESKAELTVVSNQARYISLNVLDVEEAIGIGIFLTILVVYLFLGSLRSTLITGVAIPVSLIGAFALMSLAGFSINIMTLLAFSLAVGLLIDDAIVVRENIFRHMEMGKTAKKAAHEGTAEVTMAVIAVTLTIIAVFMPIGFLSGVVGQFFKQFGLTICFIMVISLFDALTNAPMMSAYFGGRHGKEKSSGFMYRIRTPVRLFDRLQTHVETSYVRFLQKLLKRPWIALVVTGLVVLSSCIPLMKVPKTFLPAQDSGEFSVGLDMVPGTSLDKMRDRAFAVDKVIRQNPEVVNAVLTVGSRLQEKNKAEFFVFLRPFGERHKSTSTVKAELRVALNSFTDANPKVKDIDYSGSGMRPFILNLSGQDLDQVEKFSSQVMNKLVNHPALLDVDTSFRPGKPEFQVAVDLDEAQRLGVSSSMVGQELRFQVEGATPAVFREGGLEYNVRVRLKPEQRDLEKDFSGILVPNMNDRLVELRRVAKTLSTTGPASIDRENRGRYIQISADVAPTGPGMEGVISDLVTWFQKGGALEIPQGMTYRFVGQAENFQELKTNMIMAALLGLIFIYLVLSSLYESFFMPFTIMMVIPLSTCGAFFALYLSGHSLDLYSMIGCIMLMGLATKNSIILVDYINQMLSRGLPLVEAIVEAGHTRLRPILMTSLALIAGMIPVAIGLNEVSNQRSSLGVAVIGGVISSTLLTLIVIPAVYNYMEKTRIFLTRIGAWLVGTNPG
jgi:hydrophobic/amphiphilic exporter-1 (mainly G- bacteria), HAE1 family